jgi:phosphoglycolate phosphatase-like HAD superfamily hydrolase
LLLRASKLHRLDLANSWMIGDTLDDVEAGQRAGCRTILVDNGGETEWVGGRNRRPHFAVRNLDEAARIVLEEHRPVIRFPRWSEEGNGSVKRHG